MKGIAQRGIDFGQTPALELFGGNGSMFTREIAAYVAGFEVWEIDPIAADILQQNIPTAKVRIVDSIQEVRTAEGQYGLISIDNPMSTFGPCYCEHFDLFPNVFRLAAQQSIFIVTFIPRINARLKRRFPYLFSPQHLERRAAFYDTQTPADVSPVQAVAAFAKFAEQINSAIDWHFVQPRNDILQSLVFSLRRESGKSSWKP